LSNWPNYRSSVSHEKQGFLTNQLNISMRHISKHQIARADKVFCGRLGATPILKHPAFKYSFEICGYKNHTYGAVTGPVVAISNLFHELAHSIEFVINGDSVFDRAQHGRFDFHINQVYQFGDLYPNPTTTQCTDRECRTFAIQLKLMKSLGFRVNVIDFCKSSAQLCIWLPDWYLVDGSIDQEKISNCTQNILAFYEKQNFNNLIDAQMCWLDQIQKADPGTPSK